MNLQVECLKYIRTWIIDNPVSNLSTGRFCWFMIELLRLSTEGFCREPVFVEQLRGLSTPG